MIEVFETLTANGGTSPVLWQGGNGVFSASGDWGGGGRLYLEISHDNGETWIKTDSTYDYLSNDGSFVFYNIDGGLVRGYLDHASSPNLKVWIGKE